MPSSHMCTHYTWTFIANLGSGLHVPEFIEIPVIINIYRANLAIVH